MGLRLSRTLPPLLDKQVILIADDETLNSLHVMRLHIGAHITEVNCEANRFLERHWIVSCYFQVRAWSTYLKEAALDILLLKGFRQQIV